MPQTMNYILLTFKTGITIPQVKYSIQPGNTGFATYAATAAAAAANLITSETTISAWSAHTPAGVELTGGSLNVVGLIDDSSFSDLRYAMYLILNTATKTARDSSQYIMAPPTEFIFAGSLSSAGSSSLAVYSNALNDDPFCDSEGHPITSVSFGHWSRRQNIRTESV